MLVAFNGSPARLRTHAIVKEPEAIRVSSLETTQA
jgi:hypothetical protein